MSHVFQDYSKNCTNICFLALSIVFGRYINLHSIIFKNAPILQEEKRKTYLYFYSLSIQIMTKTLIAGLATIIVAGTALVGTGMYAAVSTTSTNNNATSGWSMGPRMNRENPENITATLSGKVSTEALTALQALMAKHKTEMDALRSNSGTTIDTTAMDAQHTAFRTEMDALMVKYPELKTAMPQMGEKMGRGNGEFEATIATLPATTQTELKAIRDEYKTKQDALRTEEKAKIDTILAKYPEVKTKLDTLEANRPQGMEGKGRHGGKNGGQRGMMGNSTTAN
jgi:hypothetical protein